MELIKRKGTHIEMKLHRIFTKCATYKTIKTILYETNSHLFYIWIVEHDTTISMEKINRELKNHKNVDK